MSKVKRCTVCRAPVQTINYALGPELMHYDPAASFPTEGKGSAWRYCRISMATLNPTTADEKGAGR